MLTYMSPQQQLCSNRGGERVTLEWVGEKYKHDAFKPPFFQSQATFDRCMTEIVDWWKEPALQLALSVQTALADALDP